MLTYRQVATYQGDQIPFVSGITDMQAFRINGGYALYTVTQIGGGISAYRLGAADQPLELTGSRAYAPGVGYLDTPLAALVDLNGGASLFGVGLSDGVSGGVRLGADGGLGSGTALSQLGADVTQLGSFDTPLGTFIYSARNSQASFTISKLLDDGSLSKVDSSSLPWVPGQQGTEIDDMQVARIGDRNFMLTTSALGNYIAIQGINGDGTLGRAQVMWSDSGIGLAAPSHIGTASVQGVTYLVVASSQSLSLTTMRITYDGTLIPVDHIVDSLNTRFSNATALETVMVNGRAFIFAGGSDDGISVFTLMPNGRLLHLTTLTDTNSNTLADVSAIQATVVDGKIALFVASSTESGLTQLVFDPGQIGDTRTVGEGVVNGTSGDDLLRAGTGTTRIRGGDGDDILISGAEEVELNGGNGADTFVLTPVSGQIVIRDFELGVDRLDLTNLGMLRSTSQLTFRWQWDGIKLVFGDTTIVIRTKDGNTLQASDFDNSMFPVSHYQPPEPPSNLVGTDGADTLTAQVGNNYLYGLDGADLLMGASGKDTIIAGAGNDTLMGDAGADRLLGGDGNDRLNGDDGDDELLGGDGDDTLYGGAGDDRLYGFDGNDAILGEAGNDYIEDTTGTNRIWGGDGNDEIVSGSGNDALAGNAGDDTIWAGYGNDSLYGGDGNDLLYGGYGNDSIDGGLGQDTIQAGPGENIVHGEDGDDSILGGDDNDRLSGGYGRDLIYGDLGNDSIWGNADNDTIRGNEGNDVISGDAGNDSIAGGPGSDSIWGSTGLDTIYGGDDADFIDGGDGNDRLLGEAGNDRIYGGLGTDVIWGGDGNDTIRGNAGTDSIFGDAGNDSIAGGADRDSIWGGAGLDTIYGGDGSDYLNGGDGDDFLLGEAGNDRIYGGTGNDRIRGGDGNDSISGEFGNNRLAGGNGNDLILGGAGSDYLYGEAGDDRMNGGAGTDVMSGGSGNDWIRDLLGSGRLSGGSGNDTLIAGDGRDTLNGGSGSDLMQGGAGDDIFVFGSSLSFDRSTDIIADFGNGHDALYFQGLGLRYIGDAEFSAARQIRCTTDGTDSTLQVDLNGDGRTDLTIVLQHYASVTRDDFLL